MRTRRVPITTLATVEPYIPAAADRISVTLSGITSGIITPGGAPTEADVTLCNNSAVAYPKIGLVPVLQRCTDVAVDAARNVYVLDKSGFGREVKLAAR
jgi:hypothetical protein